jgi:hypothetical protein
MGRTLSDNFCSAQTALFKIQMRPDLSSGANLQPTGGVVTTAIAYFGTYQVQGKEITVKVEGQLVQIGRTRPSSAL